MKKAIFIFKAAQTGIPHLFISMVKAPLLFFAISAMLLLNVRAFSQADTSGKLYDILRVQDSLLFTIGFNQCAVTRFESLLSNDFEFYHDQSGATRTKADFIAGIRDGLCKLPYRPERELKAGSLKVFPLYKDGSLYGAIQTGEHSFYAVENSGETHLTSIALFTHVWLLENQVWQLSRGFSYDHRVAASPDNERPADR